MFQNGCKTCFALDEQDQVLPQRAGTAGAIFPHNKLWNHTPLKVCFLNSIDPNWSWTYNGFKNKGTGGVIGTSDVLTLANLWTTKLVYHGISKDKREKVPAFIQVPDPENSDIRVWFRSKLPDIGRYRYKCLVYEGGCQTIERKAWKT